MKDNDELKNKSRKTKIIDMIILGTGIILIVGSILMQKFPTEEIQNNPGEFYTTNK